MVGKVVLVEVVRVEGVTVDEVSVTLEAEVLGDTVVVGFHVPTKGEVGPIDLLAAWIGANQSFHYGETGSTKKRGKLLTDRSTPIQVLSSPSARTSLGM